MTSNHVIHLENLQFNYYEKHILSFEHLTIQSGESVFLYGPSGSGKTTLLNLLLGVHLPTSGRALVLGQELASLSLRDRDHLRGEKMGAIFQSFNLIPFLSVEENILLPLQMNAERRNKVHNLHQELETLLDHLNIKKLRNEKAMHLSVGQQQRVAAARSLIGSPELIIADEPTSALDQEHKEAFIKLLMKEQARTRSTLIFVSHDQTLKHLFERNIDLTKINQIYTHKAEDEL